MCQNDLLSTPSRPIPLESSFLREHGREETEKAIRQIVRSVEFELMESENALRLMGPKMSYHRVDPHLSEGLQRFGKNMTLADVLAFRSSRPNFDLCFEDSWTGYFIAGQFEQQGPSHDLVLIHLDDHADMMPTLLCQSAKSLINPSSGAAFDPTSSNDWKSAIYSGAVNIGNYITPLFYSGSMLHVCHINNSVECADISYISQQPRQYSLIPDKLFADIHKSSDDSGEIVGTYLRGSDPGALLHGIPRSRTLLHIDLDYFINDFNGTSRGADYVPSPDSKTIALEKMDRFFNALVRLNLKIDRWIIATSPGFCSAYHWDFLLSEIDGRIHDSRSALARA